MIFKICNYDQEQIDTFYKIVIIKKIHLSPFNNLSKKEDVINIISNLSDKIDALVITLLPENLTLNSSKRNSNSGALSANSLAFNLTPQSDELQLLLEDYNNKEVVCLLDNNTKTYVYGNTQTPLLLSYSEKHENTAQGLKGFTININGNTLGGPKILNLIDLNIFNRGLAFTLTGGL